MSLLACAKEIMSCTDQDLAEALGINPNTLSAYVHGRRTEYLNEKQIDLLLGMLEGYVELTKAAVASFRLFT